MSYDYDLDIDTDKSPSEILSILSKNSKLQKVKGEEALGSPGLRIVAWQIDDKYDVELTEKTFGFTPKITVAFCHSVPEPEGTSIEDILAAVLALLNVVGGDAVLQTEDPIVVLQRQKGQIFVNSKWEGYEEICRLAPSCRVKAFEDL